MICHRSAVPTLSVAQPSCDVRTRICAKPRLGYHSIRTEPPLTLRPSFCVGLQPVWLPLAGGVTCDLSKELPKERPSFSELCFSSGSETIIGRFITIRPSARHSRIWFSGGTTRSNVIEAATK
jgi:hypothetical protein